MAESFPAGGDRIALGIADGRVDRLRVDIDAEHRRRRAGRGDGRTPGAAAVVEQETPGVTVLRAIRARKAAPSREPVPKAILVEDQIDRLR